MGSINALLGRISRFVGGNSGTGTNENIIGNGRYIQNSQHESMNINPNALPPFTMDRRHLAKALKLMDQVIKHCHSQRLNLKNSPPFILDILPDTYSHLMIIFTSNNNILRENEYIRIFIDNLISKCKATVKLFKTNTIYDDQSEERRKLTKISLTLSHMLFEIKAQFPNGSFIGEKFRVTKREAEEFWQEKFPNRNYVPWTVFLKALEELHNQPISKIEAAELKATIDLTGDDFVTNFEFDVFTRLFYPFKTLVKNWQTLTTGHPGYCAFLTYDEVKKRLEKLSNKPGSYIFRLSCTRPGQWAIGYVAPDGKIYQTIPQNKSLIQALHEGNKEGFYKYPNGRDQDVNLARLMEMPIAERMQVTSEQHALYTEMGTTFELCKICDDNEKNVKIEPCGHLLCNKCLIRWQNQFLKETDGAGNTCPFCRYEIKGTNRIIIDRFVPKPKVESEFMEIDYSSKKDDNCITSINPHCVPSVTDLPVVPPPVPPKKIAPSSSSAAKNVNKNVSYVNIKELEENRPVGQTPRPSEPVAPPLPPRPGEYINTSVLQQQSNSHHVQPNLLD